MRSEYSLAEITLSPQGKVETFTAEQPPVNDQIGLLTRAQASFQYKPTADVAAKVTNFLTGPWFVPAGTYKSNPESKVFDITATISTDNSVGKLLAKNINRDVKSSMFIIVSDNSILLIDDGKLKPFILDYFRNALFFDNGTAYVKSGVSTETMKQAVTENTPLYKKLISQINALYPPTNTIPLPNPPPSVQLLSEGSTVQCLPPYPPGGSELHAYRYESGHIRHYPTTEIAASWNPNWANDIKKINCSNVRIGPPMDVRGKPITPVPLVSEGSTVQCLPPYPPGGSENHAYRFTDGMIRHYPTPDIATTWNPTWYSDIKKIDCSRINVGEPMPARGSTSDPLLSKQQMLCVGCNHAINQACKGVTPGQGRIKDCRLIARRTISELCSNCQPPPSDDEPAKEKFHVPESQCCNARGEISPPTYFELPMADCSEIEGETVEIDRRSGRIQTHVRPYSTTLIVLLVVLLILIAFYMDK